MVTDVAATQTLGSEGMYGWSGIYGTNFWVDPKEKLVAIMMVQRYPGPPAGAGPFQALAYQADDPHQVVRDFLSAISANVPR